MSRRKTAKRTTKHQTMNKSSSSMQKIEKDFKGVPAKLAAQVKKEIFAHKQKENKLKTTLSTVKAQIKKAENNLKAVKGKETKSAKKQLKTWKKIHSTHLKQQSDLTKQLNEANKTSDQLNNQRDKFVALSKQLNQFEKDWAKKSKKTKATKKVTQKKRKDNDSLFTPSTFEKHWTEQPLESTVPDHVTHDETEEVS